jgi:hypothetical protein
MMRSCATAEVALRFGYMGEFTEQPPPKPLIIFSKHDKCPVCRNMSVPRIRPEEKATASCCRLCGTIVEIPRALALPGLFD